VQFTHFSRAYGNTAPIDQTMLDSRKKPADGIIVSREIVAHTCERG
jgi:hypothetical protein